MIRTIHHLSCSGGTIICRCLAAMQGVVLLSEINPTNTSTFTFTPLCPLHQFVKNYYSLTEEELQAFFLYQIDLIEKKCTQNDQVLVLRDHSHSDFLSLLPSGARALQRFLLSKYKICSVITIRNPIDCYLGMRANGWHKGVQDFNTYCERSLLFLDAYPTSNYLRYENFVTNSNTFLQRLCNLLEIEFDPAYATRIKGTPLTGNSGRGGDFIHARPRRPYDAAFKAEVRSSRFYPMLIERTGYHEKEFCS